MKDANFEALMESVKRENDNQYQSIITGNWLQGRTAFGGVSSALAAKALRFNVDDNRPMRGMTVAFIGPATAGTASIKTDILRSGKSATWASADLFSEQNLATRLQVVYGPSRSSSLDLRGTPLGPMPAPEDCKPFGYIENVTPKLLSNFDTRWAIGDMPFSNSDKTEIGAWVRFKNDAPMSEYRLIAFMDLLPPAVLPMLSQPAPISSLTWHVEVLEDFAQYCGQENHDWWFKSMQSAAIGGGFTQQHATLYAPDGVAVAYSQQVVATFE